LLTCKLSRALRAQNLTLKKLEDERRVELEVRRFRNPQPDEQIDIPDLTASELASYNSWTRRFDRDEARWLAKEKALRNLSLEIVQTIDVKHLDLILSCADAHDQLKTLKKHLRPSIGERNHQLRAQYRAVCTKPRRANLDAWFDEWVTKTRLLAEANMPEIAGNRAQEEFILLIRGRVAISQFSQLSVQIWPKSDSTSDLY
jgi:hypothetical protein